MHVIYTICNLVYRKTKVKLLSRNKFESNKNVGLLMKLHYGEVQLYLDIKVS